MASSKALRPLDAEWTRWLHTNIARGCPIEELAGILRKEGFDEIAVRQALAAAPRHRPAPAAPAAAGSTGAVPRANLVLPNAIGHAAGKVELYTADDFLEPAECAQIVALIRTKLRPSTISTPPSGEYDTAFRTSRTCDLSGEEPAVARLDAKICAALGFDPSLAEPTQGQHYEIGQVFKAHTDFFKPYEIERFSTDTLGQRTWTFMIYLNDAEGGGETEFVDIGVKVSPKRGRAVVWNNLLRSGEGNGATRHQSLPVTAGNKTIITKWFRMPRGKPAVFSSGTFAWTQPSKPLS